MHDVAESSDTLKAMDIVGLTTQVCTMYTCA